MSADTHPTWCITAQCDGEVHSGERYILTLDSIGWDPNVPIEVYPTWAGEDGSPAFPGVYLYVGGEGSLTAAEARKFAAMLLNAADALDDGAAR